MFSTFNHYTVNTGDHAVQSVNAVSPDIVKRVRKGIDYNLGDTEPCALFPGLDPDDAAAPRRQFEMLGVL